MPTTTTTAMTVADHLASPLPVGTPVRFSPAYECNGRDATTGTVYTVHNHGSSVAYAIRLEGDFYAHRDIFSGSTDNVQRDAVGTAAPVLPRTAAEVVETASVLQDLARWLPGGELNTIAHEHAEQANLCGEYEAIVCPLLGWVPRNGTESSMMRHVTTFHAELAAFEAAHAHLDVLARTRLWLERYEDGGPVNQAIVDHAERHLEYHKREAVNELLESALGWSHLIGVERDYLVTVRVRRTIEVDAWQDITITRTADSSDAAADSVDDYYVSDHTDDYEWRDGNGDIIPGYHPTGRSDIEDYEVTDVTED